MIKIDQLKKCSLFQGVSDEELEKICRQKPWKEAILSKVEAVFPFSELAQTMAIVLEGKVQVRKILPNGNFVDVAIKMDGDTIGQAAVFSKQQVYPCQLVTLEETKLLLFEEMQMVKLLQENTTILRNFLSEMATVTFELQSRMELLSFSGIAQKIACYLLMHEQRCPGSPCPVPGSMTQWAGILNVSRTSLHREVKGLEKAGLIAVKDKKIHILNKKELRKRIER